MTRRSEYIREAVQKLTEAIWNLDQLEPLDPELKTQYLRIEEIRGCLVKLIREET